MKRRAGVAELLDGPLDRAVLAENLRDLARVNRLLGGADLSWRALEPLLRRRLTDAAPLRLLDIGTGAADVPRELLRRAAALHLGLDVVATDVRPEIVELAAKASQGIRGLSVELAGEDRLAAAAGSYDVVHASLVLHHLEPPAATRLLQEMGRVARSAVIVNDLERHAAWFAGAWLASHLLTLNRYTRHDAPLSVRRAYTASEMANLARTAGLRPTARYRARPPYRYALVFISDEDPDA